MMRPVAFLSRLAEADREALAARWTVRAYETGEMIIAHDESGRDVFFVLEGRAPRNRLLGDRPSGRLPRCRARRDLRRACRD